MEGLNWLNLLLVPMVGLLMQIRADLAAMQAIQVEHARRLNAIDDKPPNRKRLEA